MQFASAQSEQLQADLEVREFCVVREALPIEQCQKVSDSIESLLRFLLRFHAIKPIGVSGFCQMTLSPNNIRTRLVPGVVELQDLAISSLIEHQVIPEGWGDQTHKQQRTVFGNMLLPNGFVKLHRDREQLTQGTILGVLQGERSVQVLPACGKYSVGPPPLEALPAPVFLNVGDVAYFPPSRPWHLVSNLGDSPGIAMPIAPEIRQLRGLDAA